jgi:hypothetical protein
MFLGCVVYPNNWSDPRIVEVCETSANYNSGKCRIKWAYILAIIGIFDILLLAVLAIVLSQTQATNYKIATAVNIVDTTSTCNVTGGGEQHVIVSETNGAFAADNAIAAHQHHHDEYLSKQHQQQNDDHSFRDFQI